MGKHITDNVWTGCFISCYNIYALALVARASRKSLELQADMSKDPKINQRQLKKCLCRLIRMTKQVKFNPQEIPAQTFKPQRKDISQPYRFTHYLTPVKYSFAKLRCLLSIIPNNAHKSCI